MSPTSIEFWLPFPPTVNRIWHYSRAAGKVYLSPDYKRWIKMSDVAASEQSLGRSPVLGLFSATIRLSTAFKRNGDIDNRIKTVLDWCQRAQCIVNDKMCESVSASWDDEIERDCIVLLKGEIAFSDRWMLASTLAKLSKKKRPPSTYAGQKIRRRAP
jgi:crossover junction endodeoxyribonuclease RusA